MTSLNVDTSRYEIVDSEHGKGGFGKVSKQRDTFLERFVAVKGQNTAGDAELRARLIREAKTLAKMSHPNIPAIYDVKLLDNELLIYFEFIDGENLRQIIASGKTISLHEAVSWFTQIASAIEHSAGLGIVHRDIKPENIVISPNGSSASLVDFGIALNPDDVKRITHENYVVGTWAYMSPEQRDNEPLDEASDIYSLALTLYETLAGHLPVSGGGYRALSDADEAIPPGIDELIKACLVSDKTKRLGLAKEFSLKLRGSFRTDVPFSKLLVSGRLHELHAALSALSAEEFSAKPPGQKLLVMTRAKDLIRINKPELTRATADMITLLVRLAIEESAEHYRTIVDAAYEWGYEKQFGERGWKGDEGIRDALIEAGKNASTSSHPVLANSLIDFVGRIDLTDKDGWYYHDLRENLIGLLANPHCGKEADKLAELYDQVNAISH